MKTEKYEIHYKCGHVGHKNIYGPVSDVARAKFKKYDKVCPDCVVADIKKSDRKSGLPDLDGSEKQVNWAVTIRAKLIGEALALQKELQEEIYDDVDTKNSVLASVAKTITEYRSERTAKFFINHRDESAEDHAIKIFRAQ